MKLTLLVGIIIGCAFSLGLLYGKHVYASGFGVVSSIVLSGEFDMYKIYDTDNGAVCYAITREWWLGSSPSLTSSISCFKN